MTTLTKDQLLEMAAQKILTAQKRYEEAVELSNRIAKANIRAINAIREHRAGMFQLRQSGKANVVTIEFCEGVLETALTEIETALTGKEPKDDESAEIRFKPPKKRRLDS